MKLGLFLTLFLMAQWAFAEVTVNVKCKIKETARGSSTKVSTEMITLSSDGQQTLAIAPVMSMDRGAIFLVSLSKGNLYTDALGDEVGADYFLSVARIQNKTKELQRTSLKGKTQDMMTLTEKEGIVESVSYRKDKGKLQSKAPGALKLKYKLKRSKKIQVTCEIIN